MNKQQLVEAMMKKTGTTKKAAEDAVNAFISTIEDALKQGDKVSLVGFGVFGTKERAARSGVNPRTGAKIKIPAKMVPYFKPGKKFKELINGK